MRIMQGLPARMPDGRRYGEDKDRVSYHFYAPAWAAPQGAARRPSAALRAVGGKCSIAPRTCATAFRRSLRRRAWRSASVPAVLCRAGAGVARSRERSPIRLRYAATVSTCSVRRHLQQGFRARESEAAYRVLAAAGYHLHVVRPFAGARPLCCGRTYLSAGLVDEARREATRTLTALAPFVARGARIVGLSRPACILSATSSCRCCRRRRWSRPRALPSCSRRPSPRILPRVRCRCPSPIRAAARRICMGTATRRLSAPWRQPSAV